MSSQGVVPGALVFVGPVHVPTLEGFAYLSIVRIQGSAAIVRLAGPDASEETPEFEVKVAVLRHRVVETLESELWPGSYVGHPIAFVYPEGDTSDQWTYGLVTSYSFHDGSAQLHVRHNDQTMRIRLLSTSTVIAADRLNYALRTGEHLNVNVLNALELLDKQNQVIIACGKSRSGLPTSVTTTMLSIPYYPEDRVPLIRPDNLEIVYVRRQHIVDCELTRRGSQPPDVFKDPLLIDMDTKNAAGLSYTNAPRVTNDVDLTFSDSDDETKADSATTRQADIDLLRLQNRPLRKRARETELESRGLHLSDDIDFPAFDTRLDTHASAFRPSQIERQVHDAVAHSSLKGKNGQAVLEFAQQGPRTRFLATPPVLRGAYDFSFGIRGLSLMHFRRFYEEVETQTSPGTLNMTSFGRSNTLQSATPPANIGEIVEAFETLLYFAKGFYNSSVYDFLKAGATFIEEYAAFTRPDAATCNMLVFWINSKLGKFRSQIMLSNLPTATLIKQEFARHDGHLMELYQSHQDRRSGFTPAIAVDRPPSSSRPHLQREQRPSKAAPIPKDLRVILPRQGNKVMCMRYLSKKGCSGPAPGQCFDPNRAHFKPLALPADVKAWIDNNFMGLAPTFQDL